MKTLFSEHRWMQIVFGGLFLVAGGLLIYLAVKEVENIDKWLSIILAVGLFIFGASVITSGFFSLKNKYFTTVFVYGSIAISLGVVLCIGKINLGEILKQFVGALLLSFAVIEIGESTAMIFFKKKVVMIVLFYIFGAVLMAAGVLALVLEDELINKILYYTLGGIFALAGIIAVGYGVYYMIHDAVAKKKEAKLLASVTPEPEVEVEVKQEEQKPEEEVHPEA